MPTLVFVYHFCSDTATAVWSKAFPASPHCLLARQIEFSSFSSRWRTLITCCCLNAMNLVIDAGGAAATGWHIIRVETPPSSTTVVCSRVPAVYCRHICGHAKCCDWLSATACFTVDVVQLRFLVSRSM